MTACILEAQSLGMRFGGVHAVRDVDLQVQEGEVHAVIGPNGAGKTTFLNVLTGIYKPSSGSFSFGGRPASGLPPERLARLGIARTFQNLRLFKEMTVRENVIAGMHCRRKSNFFSCLLGLPGASAEARVAAEKAEALLERVGLAGRSRDLARSLPYGQQRLVEIARALATEPKLLLLDEPAAGMHQREAGQLAHLVRDLRGGGLTVMLVEHNVRLVMDVADAVTVLDFGQKIAQGPPEEVRRNPAVIEAYLGEENA